MYEDIIKTAVTKMGKTAAAFKGDLQTLRAGRANPQILDRISVDYFGTPTPLQQLGNVSSPEPRMLVIALWDPKMIGPVEKAIQKSELGINPSNDGKVIRLIIPELTEERRRELTKNVKKMAEEAKVAARAVRRDAIEQLKKLQKDKELTEDDVKDGEAELQKETDKAIKDIDKLAADKEKEILTV